MVKLQFQAMQSSTVEHKGLPYCAYSIRATKHHYNIDKIHKYTHLKKLTK